MIVNTNGLAPNFFEAMELPLVLGRGFTAGDDAAAPRVAIVNQAFVRIDHGGENPVGHRIGIGTGPADQVEVVGVATDAKYTELRSAAPATIYLPALQRIDGEANFALRLAAPAGTDGRTNVNPSAVFSAIRTAVRSIDPTLPALNMRTQEDQIDRLHAEERLFAQLSGLFGLLALVGLGIATGAAAAYGSGRVVAAMLSGLSPADPLTYGSVAVILLAVALLASLLPARRASHIDPIVALRIE